MRNADPAKRTTIVLPDDVDAQFRYEASRRGVSLTELAREAIAAYVVDEPEGGRDLSFFDLARVTSTVDRMSITMSPKRSSSASATIGGSHAVDRCRTARCRRRDEGDQPRGMRQTAARHDTAEVASLLSSRLGAHAELAFVRSIRNGELMVEPVVPADRRRVTELVETYSDLPLGLVDASVVAIAERLGQTRIASLDHRHLGVVRPAHYDRLELVP